MIVNSSHVLVPLLPSLLLRESLGSKVGQDESGLMDSGVVVLALLDLLLGSPLPQGLLYINAGVLAADHEADLTGGVGGNSSEAVLGNREDGAAVLLDLLDQRQVEPLTLSCNITLVNEHLCIADLYIPWVVMTPPSRRASCRSWK